MKINGQLADFPFNEQYLRAVVAAMPAAERAIKSHNGPVKIIVLPGTDTKAYKELFETLQATVDNAWYTGIRTIYSPELTLNAYQRIGRAGRMFRMMAIDQDLQKRINAILFPDLNGKSLKFVAAADIAGIYNRLSNTHKLRYSLANAIARGLVARKVAHAHHKDIVQLMSDDEAFGAEVKDAQKVWAAKRNAGIDILGKEACQDYLYVV